jgi:thiol-disulfide isomerase/thioredoxin
MRKLVILLILLATVIITAGCNEKTQAPEGSGEVKGSTDDTAGMQNNSASSQETQDNSTVVDVTQLEQINTSLQKGPVLLKIGAEWCGPCQEMKPILKDLAKEYTGKATIMSMDVDKSPKLTDYFGVNAVPDSSVIVGLENNEYVYMQEDGKVSKNRLQARILGLREKQEFEKVLNLALQNENAKPP